MLTSYSCSYGREDWSRTLAERRGSAEKKAEAEKHVSDGGPRKTLYGEPPSAFKRRAGGAPRMRTRGCTTPRLGGLA